MDPLDFAPLDGPLDAGEAKARRRALRNGRSAAYELTLNQWLGLFFVGFAWLLVLPIIGIALYASLDWLRTRGATPDFIAGVPWLTGGSVVAVVGLIVGTRYTLVPHRWDRWVRMQRFAEANGLLFIRRATSDELPVGIAAGERGVGLLSDAFVGPATGVVVGNAGEGLGRQGFVLVPSGIPDGDFAPGEEPLTGFDVVPTRDGLLALRHRSVGRSSASIRRLFATADAVRRGDWTGLR
jgi:hypothetical protein